MFPRRGDWHCAKCIFYVVDLCIVAFHYSTYRVKLRVKTFFVLDVQIGEMFIIDNGKEFMEMSLVECVLVKLREPRAVLLCRLCAKWQVFQLNLSRYAAALHYSLDAVVDAVVKVCNCVYVLAMREIFAFCGGRRIEVAKCASDADDVAGLYFVVGWGGFHCSCVSSFHDGLVIFLSISLQMAVAVVWSLMDTTDADGYFWVIDCNVEVSPSVQSVMMTSYLRKYSDSCGAL